MGYCKVLTMKERKQMEELSKKGVRNKEIAVLISRPVNTVRNEFQKHGSRKNYSAIKAQEWADSAPKRRSDSLKNWHKQFNSRQPDIIRKAKRACVQEKLVLLEQKIEIIMRILQEFQNGKNN